MKKILLALLLQVVAIQSAQALCNSGNTVTSALTISSNCDGFGSVPLTLDTNANLTIDQGVTVSNDRYSTRNGDPIRVLSNASGVSITNYGTIYTGSQWAITVNSGAVVDSITNFGRIESGQRRGIVDNGTINTITNVGVILGPLAALTTGPDVHVLNNLQGSAQGAALYASGNPLQYNIIIRTASDYGQLQLGGNPSGMSFNIYGNTGTTLVTGVAASSITAGRYLNVLQGVSSLSGVTIVGGGIYSGYNFSLVADAALENAWDLLAVLAGPSSVDTQSSVHNSAQKMRSIFNTAAISTNFANMNTYDCNLFDTKGMCISAGGRYTTVDNPSSNSSSAVVVVGYKASPNIRIGGFLDQNFNTTTPTGIHIANKNPMMGAFAVWNQNEDHLGYQVKIANAYQDKDVTTTRDVIGTSEAGRGKTELNTQSYVGELSYAFTFKDKTLVRPYLALRHTTIKQDAYTEDTTVTVPLTYAALEDKSTAALLGIKLNHALTPKVNLTASLGVEQDLNHKVDQYAASGVSGLTSENFNDNIKHTRPVASLGAYYALTKTQRISGDVYYQQLPFQSTGSTTAYFNYTVGL